jgi:kinesin family protein 4/21/27
VEENISTIQYASRANHIHNKPTKNDDPKQKMIDELKKQLANCKEELLQANQTIEFLTKITGENPQKIKQIIDKYNSDEAEKASNAKRGRNNKLNRSRESSCTCSREGSIVEKR